MKSKHLLLMLLLALLAPWAANAQSPLFSEDFESGSMPTGWTTDGSGTWSVSTGDYSSSTGAGHGSYNAKIGHGTTDAATKLITPEIDLSSVASAELSFMHVQRSWAGDIDGLKVYYRTSSSGTWTLLEEYTSAYASWTTEEGIVLPNLSSTYQVAFEYIDHYGYGLGVDNVIITQGASCVKPSTLTATAPYGYDAAHCILLEWEGGSGSYNVQLKKASESEEQWQTKAGGVSLLSMLFNDLEPMTTYNARVQSVCGGDVSDWKNVTFTTACAAITVTDTWVENFNDLTSGIPNCWNNDEGTTTDASYRWNYYATGHEGAGLRFDSYNNSNGNTNFLKTPTLNFATGKVMQLRFWYKNPTGGDFSVYISTDGGTTYTTELVTSLTGASSWTPQEIDLTDYVDAQNVVIVFKGTSNWGSGDARIYLDDVEIVEAPSCLKPTELNASNITTHTADLSWTANSGENAWTLYYKKTTDENYTEVANVTENPYTLPGLDHSTYYQFYVVAHCSATDNSEFSDVATFATACDAISTFPVTYTFETSDGFPSNASTPTTNQLGACWRNEATVQNGSNSTRVWGTSTTHKNGSQSLILPDKGNSSNPAKTMLVFPAMNFTSANGYVVSFWVYRNGSSSNPEGFKVYASDTDTIGANAVELGHYSRNYGIAYPQVESTSNWYYYETDPIMMTGTTYIIFEGQSYYGSATYVDDVTIKVAPTCFNPTEAHAEVLDANNATISWTPNPLNAAGGSYSILDAELNVVPGAEHITGTSFSLSGLDPETNYTYYVRTNCSNSEEHVELVEVNFSTPADCGAPILEADAFTNISAHKATVTWTGYTSNTAYEVSYRNPAYIDGLSEEFSGSSLPTGWTRYSGLVDDVIAGTATLTTITSGWGMVTAASNVFSSNHVKINIYGSSVKYWLVTPEINLPANSAMSFDLAQTSYSGSGNSTSAASGTREDDRLVVLITTDDGATWEILREWNNSGSSDVFNDISETPQTVNIPLASYTGNVKVAFYGESTVNNNGDNDMHIDNVTIGTAVPASAWQMVSPNPTAASTTLTGLTAQTPYEVKVKGICNGGVESEESDIQSFTTTIACPKPNTLTVAANAVDPTTKEDLTWVMTGAETDWQISCLNGAVENIIDINESAVSINPTTHEVSYTLSGLTPGQDYTVKVRANCEASVPGDATSDWSNTQNFQTEATCVEPTAFANSNVDATSADLSWTEAGSATQWQLCVNDDMDNLITLSSTDDDVTFSGQNVSYTLTGLTATTAYSVKLRAYCDAGDGNQSPWVTTSFTTLCGTYTLPYSYGFEDASDLECWNVIKTTGSTGISYADDAPEGTHVFQFYYQENPNAYLVSPVFSGTEQGLTVAFQYMNSSSSSSYTEQFQVGYTTDANAAAADFTYGDVIEGENSWQTYENTFPANTKRIAIKYIYNDAYYLRLDDFNFEAAASCPKPTFLAATNPGPHSIDLAWNEKGTATQWQICVNDDMDNLITIISNTTSGVTISGENVSYTLTGLDPETDYTVKVRAYCDDIDQSAWSNEESFTTNIACPAPTNLAVGTVESQSAELSWEGFASNYNVRYRTAEILEPVFTDDFEDGLDQWTILHGDDATAPANGYWYTINPLGGLEFESHSATDCASSWSWNGSAYQANNYLVTPQVELGGLLKFWVRTNAAYPDSYEVLLSTTGNTIEDFTETLQPMAEAPINSEWNEVVIDLGSYSGNGYIAIHHQDYDKNYLLIDDFGVFTSNIIPAGEWVNATANGNNTEITGLDPATTYDWQVQADCGSTDGESEWSAIAQFTTQNFTMTKNIVANNWYALSSPVNTPNVTDVTNLTVDDYDFYRYNEVTSTWENYKAHRSSNFTTFENGRGYIYRNSTGNDLTFTGVPNTATDYPYRLTAEGSGDLAGFNLLGNPYTTDYNYSGVCYNLTEKGTWKVNATSYDIPVCEAILIKVESETPCSFTSSKSAPKAAEALAFTVKGNGYEDVTYAMLEEGEGLNKVAHLAEEAPALSIPVDGSNYAIAYLGYEVESFPLTLNATAGEYTIALNNQISGLSYCHLLDKVTGKETDLLKGAYTFKANGNSDRFTVLLNASLENGEIAIWNGNSWIVNGEGTLQVFDVMGRRVYNQEVAGQSSLNTDELATGVYVIRLGEKSQKIVVK